MAMRTTTMQVQGAAVRQRHERIQADGIRHDGASDPRQRWWLRSGVELEDLD